MFDKQYRFMGSHAEMVNALTSVFDEASKSKLFARNLDVYINAPLIGFLYNRKGTVNTNSEIADQNIFPEQLIKNSELLKYNLRLIIILDTHHEPDEETRLDKAFRRLGDEEDLMLFDSYVLGGVEVLYEKLMVGSTDPVEYVNRMYDFLEEVNDRFNDGLSSDTIQALCSSNQK